MGSVNVMGRLDGKVALVTGAGRGFGRSVAIAYAEEGAMVVAVSRTTSELEITADKIAQRGGQVLTVALDLAIPDSVLMLKDIIIDECGRLDVLFNNAATSPWKTVEEMTIQDWDNTIAVNLRTPFLLSKAFLETMKTQRGGSIINVTSGSASRGFVAESAYCPSKYGLEGLTQCLALEFKNHNIAVNTLGVAAPQGYRLKPTELTQLEFDAVPEEVRVGYADDAAMVAAFRDAWTFMALQDGRGVTGQRLSTRTLERELAELGWEGVTEKYRGKLTKAVYDSYDFPEKVRYQTRDGGWRELVFR